MTTPIPTRTFTAPIFPFYNASQHHCEDLPKLITTPISQHNILHIPQHTLRGFIHEPYRAEIVRFGEGVLFGETVETLAIDADYDPGAEGQSVGLLEGADVFVFGVGHAGQGLMMARRGGWEWIWVFGVGLTWACEGGDS